MQLLQNVQQTVISGLSALDISNAPETIHLEHPADEQFGDYSTNIAMQLFAEQGREKGYTSPRELAQAIADEIKKLADPTVVDDVHVAGPGFINFTLSPRYLADQLSQIQDFDSFIPQIGTGKQVVVEYSSPNIAKPFTIGHLRSTVIGDAVANLHQAIGYKVYRDNHLGDWGTQFGKQIYAIKTWGSEEQIENAEHPVKELVALYVKFHEEAEKNPEIEDEGRAWFKKLEDGDPEAKRLWQKCIDWSWKEFERIYQLLGVTFTENNGRGYGESFFEDKMKDVIDELEEKKLLQDSKGARVVFFPNDKYPLMMIVKSDGATLYATRDLATDKFRLFHYGQDVQIINEVGAEQALYFNQLYEIEQMLGWVKPGQRVHVKHGLYRFKDKKMSTRKGNVIWLEDVLQEAEQRAQAIAAEKQASNTTNHSTNSDSAKVIGIGALKWNDLKRSTNLDVTFDWDELLALEGNSGPYMQYTAVRAKSVLQKAVATNPVASPTAPDSLNPEELAILRWLYRYPEVVVEAAQTYSPHLVATYLFELAQRYNSFYNKHPILNADTQEQVIFRLALTKAVAEVIQHGLHLLGIETPDRM